MVSVSSLAVKDVSCAVNEIQQQHSGKMGKFKKSESRQLASIGLTSQDLAIDVCRRVVHESNVVKRREAVASFQKTATG